MTNEDNKVKTGAWKEIQLDFHNFKVIEELGMRFPTENSKHKKRYVRVKCKLCSLEYEGLYSLFKVRDKVCRCESKKGKGFKSWSNPIRDRILVIRRGMISRCHNNLDKNYTNYGARGITVCNEWLIYPEYFYQWSLNNGYQDRLTIDRIDNDKGYCPENCRWILKGEQNLNKRNVLSIDKVMEIRKLLENKVKNKEIASLFGISHRCVSRISCGMTWSLIK